VLRTQTSRPSKSGNNNPPPPNCPHTSDDEVSEARVGRGRAGRPLRARRDGSDRDAIPQQYVIHLLGVRPRRSPRRASAARVGMSGSRTSTRSRRTSTMSRVAVSQGGAPSRSLAETCSRTRLRSWASGSFARRIYATRTERSSRRATSATSSTGRGDSHALLRCARVGPGYVQQPMDLCARYHSDLGPCFGRGSLQAEYQFTLLPEPATFTEVQEISSPVWGFESREPAGGGLLRWTARHGGSGLEVSRPLRVHAEAS